MCHVWVVEAGPPQGTFGSFEKTSSRCRNVRAVAGLREVIDGHNKLKLCCVCRVQLSGSRNPGGDAVTYKADLRAFEGGERERGEERKSCY